MNQLIQFKNTTIPQVLIALMLGCFGLSQARAVCQEGCLTNNNTVLGDDALVNDTSGDSNTAIGFQALQSNTTGDDNTVVGSRALEFNTTGTFNTATGLDALQRNTIGNGNTANGLGALRFNTTGNSNTAVGAGALQFNTSSSNNIAFGFQAGNSLTTGNNNIDIGNAGAGGESRTIRIGATTTHMNTFIAGISGVTVPGGVGVIVDTNGHLGTVVSAARFKDEIQAMDKVSEAILALKPVTFRYKHELDPDGIPQFGLVAEEVEKVNPNLVARDEQGKPYTVRYEALNAMLLNEFLKAHKAFIEEQGKVQEQRATIARLEKQIDALSAGLQKVSAQLELNKRGAKTVSNNY
jgi:endosialidase-like protein